MAPSLARKILITATTDGLVLQPFDQKRRPTPATKLKYKDASIGPVSKNGEHSDEPGKGFEAFGIVGTPVENSLPPQTTLWAIPKPGTVSITADFMVYRSSEGFGILFPDIYNKTTTSWTDTQ